MTMARNRAFTAGANALAVTDWKAAGSRTHLKVHAFDCSNLKGKSRKKIDLRKQTVLINL